MATVVVFASLSGLLVLMSTLSTIELRESRRGLDGVKSRYLAEAGYERGVGVMQQAIDNFAAAGPLNGINALFAGGGTITPFVGQPLVRGDGVTVGEFSVSMTPVAQTATSVTVEIESTGYVPAAPANLAPNQRLESWHGISVTVNFSLERSEVFDYAYFINNWGWLYGSTIYLQGNARSNGQMDMAGYQPTITGQPIYDSVAWDGVNATLSGYDDDNGDGLTDGNDGGVFSGWDIVDAHNVQGNGGNASNQHAFEDPVEMPNLTDLSTYEAKALGYGSSISIGGATMTDGVFGDGAGESGNLYLHGTAADPIVLDGPVVVQGDVIISGYVTGQGSIYTGGNVYVPDSVQYVDPPTSPRPPSNDQADTEQWLTDNWNKDFLGLFATENVVVGDHTDSNWQSWVSGWMASSLNKSEEDAGEDGIPNTADGKDGVSGTADDDVLEDDNVFTTDVYTAQDDALGIIPPGSSIGDPVPGTGEDIDGDGAYDSTITLADLALPAPLDTANWGGNMPAAGIASYSSIATLYANHLDAVFYTNHAFCYVVLGSTPAQINGALVSRNENIVYGTPSVTINHDSRLLGGDAGVAGSLLPQTIAPMIVVRWLELDEDPNYIAP